MSVHFQKDPFPSTKNTHSVSNQNPNQNPKTDTVTGLNYQIPFPSTTNYTISNPNIPNQTLATNPSPLSVAMPVIQNVQPTTTLVSQELVFKDGSKYQGSVKDGMPHGFGVMTWTDKRRYEGEWDKGVMEGQAIYLNAKGGKYVGGFSNGKFYGRGEFYFPDGRIYKGMFENNEFCGQGVLTWPDGKIYSGEFKNDWINGQGKMVLNKQDTLIGIFKDGDLWDGVRERKYQDSGLTSRDIVKNGKLISADGTGGKDCAIL